MDELLSANDCELVVKNTLNVEQVENVEFSLKPLLGHNFHLKIDFSHDDEPQSLAFFAKLMPEVPKIHTIVDNFAQVLSNYDWVTPRVYHVKSNFVVFESLRSQGFRVCDLFAFDQFLAALTTLARFHAASLAFEETKSRGCKFRLDKEYALLHLNFNLRKPEVVDLVSAALSENRVAEAIEDLEKRQFRTKFRKTLCHGSLIYKNLMFKEKECKLINIKSNFYAPPVYDVLQLIFFNANREVRQKYWDTFLQYYYNSLKEETRRYGVDIAKILTEDDFYLSVHYVLPLIKLEATILDQNDTTTQELEEILNCQLLSRENCYVIVKNKLGTTNYDFLRYQVTPLSDVSGFLGEYHKAEIKILHLSQENTIDTFIKSSPKSGIPMEIARDTDSFRREVFLYETLVRQMQKYGINTINECLPACYFHRPKEFMVFEDMSLINYHNVDALKPLEFPLLVLLTQTLAKFHACSLILEEKMSMEVGKPYRLMDVYGSYFTEPLFFENEEHKGSRAFMVGIKSVLTAVELFTEIQTDENQRNFRNFWPKLKELFYTVIRPSDRFRNVLCQCDLRTSNIMVRFQDHKPENCVLVDFQIVRYSPPAYDLLSVLHLMTDRSTRLKHEDDLIQIYYEELGKVLGSYGYSVDEVYPYEDYIEGIKYMKPQMVLQAAIDCVLTMCTPEEISEFLSDEEKCRYVYFEDRTEFMTAMCQKSGLYRNRLKECILDIYDYCNSMYTDS